MINATVTRRLVFGFCFELLQTVGIFGYIDSALMQHESFRGWRRYFGQTVEEQSSAMWGQRPRGLRRALGRRD